MSKKQWLLAGALVVGIAASFWWAFAPQPVLVDAALVKRGAFEQSIDEDGKTRVRERYIVSAPLSGELVRIEIHAGDTVKKDQVLAAILPSAPSLLDARTQRELEERVGSAQANVARVATSVARAKAASDQARADLARMQKLAQQGFVAPANKEQAQLAAQLRAREFDAAEFERHAAQHQLDQARAALMRAREPRKRNPAAAFEVRAPISGRVLRVMQENEGVVALATPIMELADVAQLEAVVDVLSTDAVQIKPGALVYLDAGSGAAGLVGRVRLVEPAAFTKISALGVEEQRVNVIIDVAVPPAQQASLGDAYRVDARIVIASAANVIKAPIGALFREDDQWTVFVIANGRAQKRPIKLGARNTTEAVVEQGLQENEMIALYPSDSVKHGVRVSARQRGS